MDSDLVFGGNPVWTFPQAFSIPFAPSRRIHIKTITRTALVLFAFVTICLPVSAQEPPLNDNRANAIELDGTNIWVGAGSNVGATLEVGEAILLPKAGGKTVWWTWTAPRSGTVELISEGTSFDNVAGIYSRMEDGSLGSLVAVGDDDLEPYYGPQSFPLGARVRGLVTANARYFIVVDGYAGATGSIQLRLSFGNETRIRRQPVSQTVGVGASFSLDETIVGISPYSFQWEKNRVPIPGATQSSYTVAEATADDVGLYRVALRTIVGVVYRVFYTEEAAIQVIPIGGHWFETNLSIGFGLTGELSFNTSGAIPIEYVWDRNGVVISNTGPTLRIDSLLPLDLGNYRVVASNQYGSVTSSVATVTRGEPWTFVTLLGRSSSLQAPCGIVLGTNGTLLVSDIGGHSIFSVQTNAVVARIAGTGGTGGHLDGPALQARFNQPRGLCLEPSGAIAVADTANHVIRRIGTDGTVSTIAGTPATKGYLDGPGTSALFNMPAAVVSSPSGDLFVADSENCVIRRIDAGGIVST
jgi:hypothetical protein